MAKLNPQGLAELKRRLGGVAVAGAYAAADVLQEKLSGPGSGRQYPGQPNRSSSPGEYPAEQTGQLVDSISARRAGELRAEFGSIIDPPEYNLDLHFKPPDEGGRPYMDDALQDRDIHQAVREAMGLK